MSSSSGRQRSVGAQQQQQLRLTTPETLHMQHLVLARGGSAGGSAADFVQLTGSLLFCIWSVLGCDDQELRPLTSG